MDKGQEQAIYKTNCNTCEDMLKPTQSEECKLSKEIIFYTRKNGKITNSYNSNY